MLLTLAGAMSTAELGISVAELIRKGKIHAICCTGANLEEDIFNLVAHDHYKRVANYRDLTPEQEKELGKKGYNCDCRRIRIGIKSNHWTPSISRTSKSISRTKKPARRIMSANRLAGSFHSRKQTR